jgi:hypothetical protein
MTKPQPSTAQRVFEQFGNREIIPLTDPSLKPFLGVTCDRVITTKANKGDYRHLQPFKIDPNSNKAPWLVRVSILAKIAETL